MKTHLCKIVQIVGIFCLFPCSVEGQDITKSVFDMFHQPDILPKIELQFDIENYIENKNTNEYFPAKLTWLKSKTISMGWNLKLRPRGKFRRRICVLPPIKLRFDKSEFKEDGRKHPSIKLVTHCIEGSSGKDLVAREQLVYELYEILTRESLRTQLVEMIYRDEKGKKYASNYGILIEDADQCAKEMGGKICDNCIGRTPEKFDSLNFDIHALFQFMIGNEDWSSLLVRNIEVVKFDSLQPLKMVPYDFDFSGLVNASYAIPNQDFKLTNCRQRVFMGNKKSTTELSEAVSHFQSKKDQILDHIKNYPYLKGKSKADIRKYVNFFYDFLEQEQSLEAVVDYPETN